MHDTSRPSETLRLHRLRFLNCRSFNGVPSPILGSVSLPVQIGRFQTKFVFYVVNNMIHNVVLGRDFYGAHVNCLRNLEKRVSLKLPSPPPPRSSIHYFKGSRENVPGCRNVRNEGLSRAGPSRHSLTSLKPSKPDVSRTDITPPSVPQPRLPLFEEKPVLTSPHLLASEPLPSPVDIPCSFDALEQVPQTLNSHVVSDPVWYFDFGVQNLLSVLLWLGLIFLCSVFCSQASGIPSSSGEPTLGLQFPSPIIFPNFTFRFGSFDVTDNVSRFSGPHNLDLCYRPLLGG